MSKLLATLIAAAFLSTGAFAADAMKPAASAASAAKKAEKKAEKAEAKKEEAKK